MTITKEAFLSVTDFDRERTLVWTDLLNLLLKANDGNICEIGAGHGNSTKLFCQIAKKWNRKVIAVDPFESDWQNMPVSYQYPIDEFLKLQDEFENLHLLAISSQDRSCFGKLLYHAPFAFAFVDGLQTVEAVLSDIAMMEKLDTGIVCLDDADRLTGDSRVPEALEQYKGEYQVMVKGREAYLWR